VAPVSQPFSKRNNFSVAASEIKIREDAPESLRLTVLNKTIGLKYQPSFLRWIICNALRQRPDPESWSEYPNIWGEVEQLMYGCKWYKVYDIIEAICEEIADSGQPKAAKSFADEVNLVCAEEGIGWQLVDGQIVTRGNDQFDQIVRKAETALVEEGRTTAAGRIKKAVQDLSARPKPDASGAVSHATGALECVLDDITGQSMTLGEFLKRYPDLFPGSMKKALEGLWGFASNEGARHGREGVGPSREDAEFVVAVAAALTTYLNSKHPRV